ncbi:MAG TPA: Tex family protein [Armatimonadota bacterium]|nr:Tex family protein [Armatimonadota bacterium]
MTSDAAQYCIKIAEELKLTVKQVVATTGLLDDGGTVPFISRYRKEATGNLDEVAVTNVRDRRAQLEELDRRREAILKSLEEQGKLTEELCGQVEAAESLTVLEDIYLPYRPKRRTRATMAKEKGLEPLAEALFAQPDELAVEATATEYVDEEKGVETTDDALAGARDIIAEWVSEDQEARAKIRQLFVQKATLRSRVVPDKQEAAAKFRDYFEWEEPLKDAPSHRILAIRRGEKEEMLTFRMTAPEDHAIRLLDAQFVTADNPAAEQVGEAVEDGYKRLLGLSIETETRMNAKERADDEAIRVFADNLRQLLLAAPLGEKAMLALDPGFRTGCKLVCLDPQGKLIHTDTIYPHTGGQRAKQAGQTVMALCARFGIEAIAIGNGTGSRETESFVRALGLPASISVVVVNESGASVYSASEVAREEFPDHDLTVRGSVSIGRRLSDPLAELVKIDPKSIGVGQYQHDVDQAKLRQGLDDVVMSCVNAVGVEVNTASKQLLTCVSGLGPKLAESIVAHRDENGAFRSRKELLKVARLGPKAFEQAAGFLRIRDAENPLDASAVHPESYEIVDRMADDCGCSVSDLMRAEEQRAKINPERYVTDTVGLPTLTDIMTELAKPGRDPRERFEPFSFAEGVEKIADVKPGMKLPGIVTNITKFGAFVDIGVHQDGLVHVSQMADRFVKDPAEVVKVAEKITVTVLEVDLERGRIGLSLKNQEAKPKTERGSAPRTRGQKPGKRPPQHSRAQQKPPPPQKTAMQEALEKAMRGS